MANAHTMAPRQHDLSVPYADVVVPGSGIDVTHWESWSYADAGREDYYAKGPCPACFAETQGHAAADIQEPVEAQGRRWRDAASGKAAAPRDTIEIPIRCQCGFTHGNQNAMGCGRAWSVIVTRTTS
jgi:hypothetical protein